MTAPSTSKREQTRKLQRDARVSEAKSRLISVLSDLDTGGLRRRADQLASIIGRLESWENSL